MARELAFALLNPYTLSKSRTGGVIARLISRTDLDFVGARMFGPSKDLVDEYAQLIRAGDPDSATTGMIADYVLRNYAPNPSTGACQRVLMLLFEGENAVEQIWRAAGSATLRWGSGETIRDTYGDYITNRDGKVRYFEPAVLVGPTSKRAEATLRLWARYSAECGGIVSRAMDVPGGEGVERTLVMLKPDNFKSRSLRPGNIIDVLSCSGLRIVGAKKFGMTVAQAEEFYGPVRQALCAKFKDIGSQRVADALFREFGFEVPEGSVDVLCRELAPLFAESQFESIVQFITGYRPSDVDVAEKATASRESCLALVYEGVNAVSVIRDILGSTDPSKARPGSVRKEFGSNIMVNAAHASDSPENAVREMGIINIEDDTVLPIVARAFGL